MTPRPTLRVCFVMAVDGLDGVGVHVDDVVEEADGEGDDVGEGVPVDAPSPPNPLSVGEGEPDL